MPRQAVSRETMSLKGSSKDSRYMSQKRATASFSSRFRLNKNKNMLTIPETLQAVE